MDVTEKEVTQDELERLNALIEKHEIQALVAKHKPQNLEISFDASWIQPNALAASYKRVKTDGPCYITLSPLLLEWGLTDRVAFSAIILHELAHVLDRVKSWTKYDPNNSLDHEALEYEADEFVVACGWKQGLIETLRRSISLLSEHGFPDGMASKRLAHLLSAA